MVVFFLLNTVGIASFNPTFRTHLQKITRWQDKQFEFKFLSLFPYFLGVIIAVISPNIIAIFGLIGLVICNFNGFIIPVLIKIKFSRGDGSGKVKIGALEALLCFYNVGGLLGLYFALKTE